MRAHHVDDSSRAGSATRVRGVLRSLAAVGVIAALLGASAVPVISGGSASPVALKVGVGDLQRYSVDRSSKQSTVQRDAVGATSATEAEALATMRRADTFPAVDRGPVRWPFPAGVPISARYGPRVAPCNGCSTFHKGLDLTPGEGVPIQAIADGRVIRASTVGGFGVHAVIEHVVDGRRYRSLYAHMRPGSLALVQGQTVQAGDLVGRVGDSGQSTGPHLHLEISDDDGNVDPYAWLARRTG